MAINTTNISPGAASGGMAYVLWGNLYVPGGHYSYDDLFRTRNVTSNMNAGSMGGQTQGTYTYPTSVSLNGQSQSSVKTQSVTATGAWAVSMTSQSPAGCFSVLSTSAQTTLQGSAGDGAVMAGNGTFTIRKLRADAGNSGTVTIYMSNGAGSRNTYSISISD
jgi:hypothetical protein